MNKALILAFVAAPLAALPGVAFAGNPVDNYAASAILQRDFATAEASLTTHLAAEPRDVMAMINLATIYRMSGRSNAADALYDRVLACPDELVDASDGKIFRAHDIARVKRGTPITLASR